MASVSIILLITFAMSYTPTPLYFIFILAGIYLLQKIAKKSVVNTTTVALFATMFLAWEMYWATPRFGYLALMHIDFWKGLANPAEAFLALFRSGESYLGGATPLWASFTRFFWMALVLGLGGILVIWNLLKTRKLDSIEVLETGGLIGAAVFTIICIFTFATIGQWGRIRTFAPLFTVPIILSYLSGVSTGRRFRGPIFILLITLVLILSLPTFLMERPAIYTESMTSDDYSAAEFLKSTYRADELEFFSTYTTIIMYSAFLPGAHLHTSPPPQKATDREALWADMNYLVKAFENSKQSISIFVLSDEFTLTPNHPAAIQLNDPRWVEFVNKLEMNNKIYDNNHIEIFQLLAE